MKIYMKKTTLPKTADFTAIARESGRTFTNTGAVATVIATLPPATLGLNFRFSCTAAQILTVDPSGVETIATPTGAQGAAGVALSLTQGQTMDIECTKAGQWEIFASSGPSVVTNRLKPNSAKTANYTVTAAETGATFTTVGAVGTVIFTLPLAVVGLNYIFRAGAAQILRLTPATGEAIANPSTGVAGAANAVLDLNTLDGEVVSIECTKAGQWSVMGYVGRLAGSVSAKTANYTVVVQDTNSVFNTVGAVGAVTFALPIATTGLAYFFRVGAAQELRLDPNGVEVIALPSTGVAGAAGKYLTCATDGATVYIMCTKAGAWSVFGFTGTWTMEV